MTNIDKLERFCYDNQIACERDALLSGKCTFKVGGKADIFIEPSAEEDIARLAAFLREHDIPWTMLGKGSNVIFPDVGIRGAVICLGENFSRMELIDETTIYCQSGASLNRLCRFALDHSLAGLEFAYGIPGSVGGAVYMNAGAYGGEMRDVLVSARHLAPDGEMGGFAETELELSYRRSIYTDSGYVITGAVISLTAGSKEDIRAKMDDYMERRRSKQPLEFPSAGSTFKRPEGAYASALIDQCGLKGLSVGGAQVSEKHAGFIINTGGATCSDILELIRRVQERVKEQTGFDLQPEVKIYS